MRQWRIISYSKYTYDQKKWKGAEEVLGRPGFTAMYTPNSPSATMEKKLSTRTHNGCSPYMKRTQHVLSTHTGHSRMPPMHAHLMLYAHGGHTMCSARNKKEVDSGYTGAQSPSLPTGQQPAVMAVHSWHARPQEARHWERRSQPGCRAPVPELCD